MSKRNVYLSNKPLSEAKELWQASLKQHGFYTRDPLETIGVDDSLDRITAEPVFAMRSSPSYNAAAMDGIAVHFNDLTGASEANPLRLSNDRFIPVNTGNAIPKGFNAVVMIEDVHYLSETEVELHMAATPWQHVRTIGEDIVATELILPEGHMIRAIDQGAMLATGITEIKGSLTIGPSDDIVDLAPLASLETIGGDLRRSHIPKGGRDRLRAPREQRLSVDASTRDKIGRSVRGRHIAAAIAYARPYRQLCGEIARRIATSAAAYQHPQIGTSL